MLLLPVADRGNCHSASLVIYLLSFDVHVFTIVFSEFDLRMVKAVITGSNIDYNYYASKSVTMRLSFLASPNSLNDGGSDGGTGSHGIFLRG